MEVSKFSVSTALRNRGSRKRHTQPVNQPGSGGTINVSGGSIEGNAYLSFGEGSTMNNYLLDSLFDECWPDTPS